MNTRVGSESTPVRSLFTTEPVGVHLGGRRVLSPGRGLGTMILQHSRISAEGLSCLEGHSSVSQSLRCHGSSLWGSEERYLSDRDPRIRVEDLILQYYELQTDSDCPESRPSRCTLGSTWAKGVSKEMFWQTRIRQTSIKVRCQDVIKHNSIWSPGISLEV